MSDKSSFFVAVTGAQGVGKSTFCRALVGRLRDTSSEAVPLLDDLGVRVAAMNVPLGSSSTPETIAAVWTTHLEREADAPEGLVLLDRCVVDALAYTRMLRLGTELDRRLLESVGLLASARLRLVIHLRLSNFFRDRGAPHETPQLRHDVAAQIGKILTDWDLPCVELDAAAPTAIDDAVAAVSSAYSGTSCA